MKKLIILIFPLFLSSGLYAQKRNDNAIALHWGVGNIMRQDLTVSPFIHKKWSPVNVLMSYSRSNKLIHFADLKFSFYNPSIVEPYAYNSFYGGEQTSMPNSFKLIDFNYALGKTVLEKSPWELVIGGKSRNHIYASDYNFGPSGPSPMHVSFGLDLWLNLKYALNKKHYFTTNLSLPLFAYIYRVPYLAQDDQYFETIYSHNGITEFASRIKDGQLQSWGVSQRFDFDVRYGYVINEKWDIGMNYLLSMNFNQLPTRISQIENAIYLSGKYKF
ncbi:MAG: hypothetical protein OEW75_10090 [Cyclobacteriaceae bacterium]|nr:hypothetical protein [Cyclobacteriaceae bacterium]